MNVSIISNAESSAAEINLSMMSGPPEKCEICQYKLDINHICIPVEEFKSMAFNDFTKDNEDSKESTNNEFIHFNVPAINSSDDESPIVYADEGDFDDSPPELSIIEDLEESIGYQTRALETPPRAPRPPRRRSSTPNRRRRSLTFDEFIQNLMNDEEILPGLEDDRQHEMSLLSIDGSAEFMDL